MKRREFLQLSTALLASGALGAMRPAFAQTTPGMGGTIRVAMQAQPGSLDPHMTTADATAQVARNVFEQLLALNSGYQYAPMLAESFDQSDDGLTFTFHLRQGVKFHNGKTMTADDVIASLEKWITTNSKKTMFEVHTLAAPDDHTVVLTMAKKVYGVLEALADNGQFAGIMPKEIVEAADATGVTEYIGTGPFKFAEWSRDQFVRLVRNDDYQPLAGPPDGLVGDKTAHADELIYYFVADPSTRIAGIMTGEYDVADSLPIDYYEQVRGNADLDILKRSLNLVAIYNKKEGLLANVAMRKAVNAALDSEAIMLAVQSFPEFFRLDPSYMYEEQANWHSTAGANQYSQNDPELAKKYLAEAGYANEPVRILTSKDHAHLFNSSVVIQQQLAAAGMNARLDVYDWPTTLEHRGKSSDWDITVTGFPLVLAPTQLLYLSANWAGWTDDPTIAKHIAEINASTSLDEAKAIWQALQGYCWEDYLPVSKLGDRIAYAAYSRRLLGLASLEGGVFWSAGFAG